MASSWCVIAVLVAVSAAPFAVYGQTSTSSVDTAIDEYNGLLSSASRTMQTALEQPITTCNRRAACGTTASDLTAYNVSPTTAIPSDYDFVQTKARDAADVTSQDLVDLCQGFSLRSTWTRILSENRGKVLFQYLATATENFAVYPPLKWNCTEPYVPSERPYYVAGATGQKDMVILVETSQVGEAAAAATRVAMAKRAAVKLLKTLSFRDYVAVFALDVNAEPVLSSNLLQATSANVDLLVAAVQRLRSDDGANKVSVRAGLEAAATVFRTSEQSSGCNQVVALLSSGFDDSTDAFQVVEANPSMLVVGTYLAPSAEVEVPAALRRVTCASRGLAVAATDSNVEEKVLAVNDYFARLLNNGVVRWSEDYDDAFGQGRIVSGALPVYNTTTGGLLGLVVMDVPLSQLQNGGQLTAAEVRTALLRQQSCQDLDRRGGNAGAVASLQGDQCDGLVYPTYDEPLNDRLKPLYVVLLVVATIAVLATPLVCAKCQYKDGSVFTRAVLIVCCAGVLFLIGHSVLWATVYDDSVDRAEFEEVEYSVTRIESNPYRCCDRVDCSCTEFTGVDCPSLLQNLTEGLCGGGYKCCRESCRSCNCRTTGSGNSRRRTCDRCCDCVQSVRNQGCRVVCGTCYNPTIYAQYTHNGGSIDSFVDTRCGRDDVACNDNFLNVAVGDTAVGYVDPANPSQLRRERPSVSTLGVVAAVLLFVVGLCVSCGALAMVFMSD